MHKVCPQSCLAYPYSIVSWAQGHLWICWSPQYQRSFSIAYKWSRLIPNHHRTKHIISSGHYSGQQGSHMVFISWKSPKFWSLVLEYSLILTLKVLEKPLYLSQQVYKLMLDITCFIHFATAGTKIYVLLIFLKKIHPIQWDWNICFDYLTTVYLYWNSALKSYASGQLMRCHHTFLGQTLSKADSKFGPSQWETASLYNSVCHWLCVSLESALLRMLNWDLIALVSLTHMPFLQLNKSHYRECLSKKPSFQGLPCMLKTHLASKIQRPAKTAPVWLISTGWHFWRGTHWKQVVNKCFGYWNGIVIILMIIFIIDCTRSCLVDNF